MKYFVMCLILVELLVIRIDILDEPIGLWEGIGIGAALLGSVVGIIVKIAEIVNGMRG